MTELRRAVEFAASIFAAEVTEREREAAYRCFVDTIACAIAGSRNQITTAVLTAVGESGPDGARLIGNSARVRRADAMLVHAAAIRCLDFNDVYSARNNHHPSENVIPAVLALADSGRWTGAQVIDAVARGYRVSLGIGELWTGLLSRGWAPSGTLGRMSIAVFMAMLAGENEEVILHAVAIAAVTSPTLGVVFKGEMSDLKSLVNGMAGRAAWEAVDLSRAGITGPVDALDGVAGFSEIIGGPIDFDGLHAGAPEVSLKAYPTVFMTHASIAAAINIARGIRDTREIKAVTVTVPEAVALMAASPKRWNASTQEQAQFSLPVAVAAALIYGECGLEQLSTERVAGRDVRGLVSKMTVEPDSRRSGYEGGKVVVELNDGSCVTSELSVPPGHPSSPFTDQQLFSKFRSLAAVGLEPEAVESAVAALENLRLAPDLDDLFDSTSGSFT